MDDLDLILSMMLLLFCYCWVEEHLETRTRRWWVRPNNQSREVDGYFRTVCLLMKECDPEECFKHTWMTRSTYDLLLVLIKEKLTRFSQRSDITAECRLASTLSFLSQRVSHTFLCWSFKMGRETVRKVILETCDDIWTVLKEFYVNTPNIEEFRSIADDFQNRWDMPHCVGAIDGKHITIQNPSNSGSAFYNYKSAFSIVQLAACDSKYTFTYVDIGAYGSQSDGGILANSTFARKLLSAKLPLPPAARLPNSEVNFPYYFVADNAFPSKENLIRPYPGKRLDRSRRVFNYRLSRARVVIENTFGILVSRWKVLRNSLTCFPQNAEKILLATIALHNFVKFNENDVSAYCPPSFVDREDEEGNVIPGDWRRQAGSDNIFASARMGSNNATRSAFHLRDSFK